MDRPRLPERTQAVLFAAVLVTAVAGLWWSVQVLNAPPVPGEAVTASLRIEGDGWSLAHLNVTTANGTAFALLLEAADRHDLTVTWRAYGPPLEAVLVTAIGPDRNGDDGRWWQYWINGRYGDVGADRKPLAEGDVVLWRFVPYPPPEGAP